MASIFWNPPSKFACPCYPYTQQVLDWILGPQSSLAFSNKAATELLRPKFDIPVPGKPLCTGCSQKIADAEKSPKRVTVRLSPESIIGKFLGKRLVPQGEESHHEKLRHPDIADVEYMNDDAFPHTKGFRRKLFSIPRAKDDPRGSLPSLKRRKVEVVAPEPEKEETAAPRRPSPTSSCQACV